jgi:hypothetical protein
MGFARALTILQQRANSTRRLKEARTRMEPEARGKRLLPRIETIILLAAFAGGIAAAVYFWDLVAIGLIGCGLFIGLAIAYTVLALLFGWPRLRWRAFLSEVVNFLMMT